MRAILPSLLTTQYPMTTSTKTETAAKKDVTKLQRAIVDGLEDVKAQDLVVLDVRGIASFTDYFIIMSGQSTRHVQGLAEAIEEELRAKRASSKHSEGLRDGLWVLLDLGDVVVHAFYHEQRSFYDLEGLWHDAPRLDVDELLLHTSVQAQ